MTKAKIIQENIDISQELESKNYEKLIEYANDAQERLIHSWQIHDKAMLEHLLLMGRNILNFWTDSIVRKKLWMALVRCGAWLGTMETIQKLNYEESMDAWAGSRFPKKISSIKNLPEILQLLEVKGVLTHSELAEGLHFNHLSTLTEIMKKIADMDLIDVRKAGKYSLYSLTDTGIRCAKQLRAQGGKHILLQNLVREYALPLSEDELDMLLRSANESILIKQGQELKLKMDNERPQSVKVEHILKSVSYDSNGEGECFLNLKTQRIAENMEKEESINSAKITKAIVRGKITKYEMGA